jgi:hypothetical protein
VFDVQRPSDAANKGLGIDDGQSVEEKKENQNNVRRGTLMNKAKNSEI